MNKLPTFFNYEEEETDNGYETTQDFILSWTLRCALDKYKQVNPLINGYSKKALFFLLYGENTETLKEYLISKEYEDNFQVTFIKTYRQKHQIDLLIEVEVIEHSKAQKYILNIENKWYTKISKTQLAKSKEFIESEYSSNVYIKRHLVIFFEPTFKDFDIQMCKENKYKILTISNIDKYMDIDKLNATGNDIFDEYWIRF
ncbi:MAG: hypothetical protein CVU09_07290 [Bacteroidetes bacterium HGW-Bacteroidetes-4]|jgi:hypothetical protein|nr:MAG: hypothetical protein CVU09_07290 [Bacteroidetes bacterium HGW-Bacteroidetes-4]